MAREKKAENPRHAALDLTADEFRALGHELIDQIAGFYESLPERPLTRATDPDHVRELLGTSELPERGSAPAELLAEITPLLFDNSLHNGHPKFMGYITSSAAPLGALADLLAAAVNANLGKWELSPVASEIETQTVRWLADFIGYNTDCGGLMASGGNMANFIAFVAARKAKTPWDIRRDGTYGDPRRLTAYVSEETHTWVQKAADVCGLGATGIRWIETDGDGRVLVERLREQVAADREAGCLPFLVVGTGGSVSTGVIDPLRQLAELCRDEDLWFHVDGAYGAPAAALPESPEDLRALRLADSVALDPHKWLYCPIEAACVLTRDPDALKDAFSFRPDYYLFDASQATGIDYYEHGMQNSRGFRALKVWLALRQAGREGYQASIRDDIRLAQRLFDRVGGHPEFETHAINLSIATFRYVPPDDGPLTDDYLNELNQALLAQMQSGGELFLSNAVIDGRYLLRACIVNFRTAEADIDALPELIAELGRAAHRRLQGSR